MQEDAVARRGKRPANKKIIKIAGAAIGVMLIFLLGIGIGNGTILLSSATNSTGKTLPDNLNYTSVEQLYDILKANYDGKLDAQALQDGMRAGLISAAGDPYTQYFSAKEAEEFNQELNGSFIGIGAELGENADGDLIIATPIKGFPAEQAGLRAQDVIVSINGKSTADTTIAEAVKQIRGEKGTDVTLRVLRNKKEDLSFKITRDEIKIPSVKWEVSDDKIGYLQITQFSQDTNGLARKAAQEFKDKKVKGVVLDMRSNPGGLLDSAVAVASLWLPAGKTVLAQKQGGVTVQTYMATGNPVLEDVPTAVLIDGGSASASEIVAGALKDNKVATLYGEKSYGKGSVQEIHNLPNGEEVKITIARWYRPNGQNIDKKGIKPDREVKLTEEDYRQKRDPQKDAAFEFIRAR